MGLYSVFVKTISYVYDSVFLFFPDFFRPAVNLFFFAIAVSLVSLFIWYFYKSISQKDLITLNLSKYNKSEHPFFAKFFGILFYLVEYILIIPLLMISWFLALTFIILTLANESSAENVVLLSAVMIAAIRILSYFNSEISQDLAKLFPFITLSVFLLNPLSLNFSVVLTHLKEIPGVLSNLGIYMLAIFIIEITLRIINTFSNFFNFLKTS